MNTFILELTKDGQTETTTSGSRLELIMKARMTEHDSAEIKNADCKNKLVWQSQK